MSLNRGQVKGATPPEQRPAPPRHTPAAAQIETIPNKPKIKKKSDAPQKHRPVDVCSFFKRTASGHPNTVKSFHIVDKVKRKGRSFFYKNNAPGSIMSEIEAFNWGCYHLLTPESVPAKANVHYDAHGTPVGISSQELEGFTPAKDDPLTDADIAWYDLALMSDLPGGHINNAEKGKIYLSAAGTYVLINASGQLARGQLDTSKVSLHNLDKKLDDLPLKIALHKEVTAAGHIRDVVNNIKGLGRGLTASHVFAEDDCHSYNVSKNGKRVDFDNSNFPVTARLKPSSAINPSAFIDKTWRPDDEQRTYSVTMTDIEHFPSLQDANPFYWVTKPEPAIINGARTFIGWTGVPISKNSFTCKENPPYQKLAGNELFIYYKYLTLLKHILIPDQNWRFIAEQHIDENREAASKQFEIAKVGDMMSSFVIRRKKLFHDALVKMPSFRDFLHRHGDQAKAEIFAEFDAHNQSLKEREYGKFLKSERSRPARLMIKARIDMELVNAAYTDIFKEVRRNLCNANQSGLRKLSLSQKE